MKRWIRLWTDEAMVKKGGKESSCQGDRPGACREALKGVQRPRKTAACNRITETGRNVCRGIGGACRKTGSRDSGAAGQAGRQRTSPTVYG